MQDDLGPLVETALAPEHAPEMSTMPAGAPAAATGTLDKPRKEKKHKKEKKEKKEKKANKVMLAPISKFPGCALTGR